MTTVDRGAVRVLHVLGGLNPSGMERMLVSAAPKLTNHGLDFAVLGQGAKHPYAMTMQNAGLPLFFTPHPVSSRPGRKVLGNVLADYRPDIVHLHTEADYARTVLAIRRSGAPKIVRSIHNIFTARGSWLASRWIQAQLADPFVSAFIGVSEDVTRNEQKIGRRATTILNWVDDKFLGNQVPLTPPRAALIVGNCSAIKNHEVALEAAESLGLPVAHLGDETTASTREHEILEHMTRRGLLLSRGVSDPLPIMREHQPVFLMPSLHEGMGVALAEALAFGLYAVVADVPGLSWASAFPKRVEFVNHDVTEWKRAISGLQQRVTTTAPAAAISLSADRALREYSELYGRVTSRSR